MACPRPTASEPYCLSTDSIVPTVMLGAPNNWYLRPLFAGCSGGFTAGAADCGAVVTSITVSCLDCSAMGTGVAPPWKPLMAMRLAPVPARPLAMTGPTASKATMQTNVPNSQCGCATVIFLCGRAAAGAG